MSIMLNGRFAVCMLGKLGRISGYRQNKNGEYIFIGYTPDGKNWESKRPKVLSDHSGQLLWNSAVKEHEKLQLSKFNTKGAFAW